MELNRKLVATASCQGEGVHFVDRVTSLPDQVAHHILSFLDITDLTRFGCVSSRCNKLYLSTPTLNFCELSRSATFTCKKRLQLLRSLDRFLVHRGDNKIQCFRFRWEKDRGYESSDDEEDEDFRMITWIHNAVRCNVEVLDADVAFLSYTPVVFPPCIFLCTSLRSLTVKARYKILKAPSISALPNLEFLKLKYVDVADEEFFNWISYSCRGIKDIELFNVGGIQNITIESSSLKSFKFESSSGDDLHLSISGEKLEEISIDWILHDSYDGNQSLNISAPNLEELIWEGCLMGSHNLGKLMNLKRAVLSFYEMNLSEYIIEVLCSLCRVEYLILNKKTTEVLLKVLSSPLPFGNLSYLGMDIGTFSDEQVQPMASLFRGMPNLCTLHIFTDAGRTKCESSGFNMGFWKLQKFAFISQLKWVILELDRSSNGIEFARYILMHAQNLLSMFIHHTPEQYKAAAKLKKIKMVSNAKLILEGD